MVPGLLWTTTEGNPSDLTVQYWQMGYLYAGSLATYKAACMETPGCDWLKWLGYDGMLFVVNFRQGGTPLTAGYYAICFPNPVSSVAPVA